VLNNPAIYMDITVPAVYVGAVTGIYEWPGPVYPSPPAPAMVEDAVPMPVAIPVQPSPNAETDAEGNEPVGRVESFHIYGDRIILGNIDDFRFSRDDPDDLAFHYYLLLGSRNETPGCFSIGTELLDDVHDLLLLIDEGLTERNRPFVSVVHHEQYSRIMGNSFDTHVPWLKVNPCRFPILPDVPRRFVDLVDEGCSRQDLGNQRVRIKGNGCQQVIQFFSGEQIVTGIVCFG